MVLQHVYDRPADSKDETQIIASENTRQVKEKTEIIMTGHKNTRNVSTETSVLRRQFLKEEEEEGIMYLGIVHGKKKRMRERHKSVRQIKENKMEMWII